MQNALSFWNVGGRGSPENQPESTLVGQRVRQFSPIWGSLKMDRSPGNSRRVPMLAGWQGSINGWSISEQAPPLRCCQDSCFLSLYIVFKPPLMGKTAWVSTQLECCQNQVPTVFLKEENPYNGGMHLWHMWEAITSSWAHNNPWAVSMFRKKSRRLSWRWGDRSRLNSTQV